MEKKMKRNLYLTREVFDKVQNFADNTGLSWNATVNMILHDYFNEERKILVAHLKGEK